MVTKPINSPPIAALKASLMSLLEDAQESRISTPFLARKVRDEVDAWALEYLSEVTTFQSILNMNDIVSDNMDLIKYHLAGRIAEELVENGMTFEAHKHGIKACMLVVHVPRRKDVKTP